MSRPPSALVCGWEGAMSGASGGGAGRVLGWPLRKSPATVIGAGDAHAVRVGANHVALCGQLLRVVGTSPWPPTTAELCEVCAGLTTG